MIGGLISKFVNGNRVGNVMNCKEGCLRLQQVTDQMENWTKQCQMELNPNNPKYLL